MTLLYKCNRILAGLIDLIVFYIPCQLLTYVVLPQGNQSNLLSQFLFCLLLTVCVLGYGQTPGKFFARLKVVSSNQSDDWLWVSARELSKIVYFLPFVGLFLAIVSLVLYVLKGRFIHELLSGKEVSVTGITDKNENHLDL